MPDTPNPQDMPYSDRILGAEWTPLELRNGWTDASTADPLADIRAMKDAVLAKTGFTQGPAIITNARTAEELAVFHVWFEETKRRLGALPRHRFLARMVLKRQLWGPWYKRSRRLTRLRWKIRDWRRGEDWDG